MSVVCLKYGKPIWQLVSEAADDTEKEVFTASDIFKKIHETNPDAPEVSIRAYVIAMAPNHPFSWHWASTRKNHPYFYYLGNGKYRLLKPSDKWSIGEPQAPKTTTISAASAATVNRNFSGKGAIAQFSITGPGGSHTINAVVDMSNSGKDGQIYVSIVHPLRGTSVVSGPVDIKWSMNHVTVKTTLTLTGVAGRVGTHNITIS